jgi:hypothetical protein
LAFDPAVQAKRSLYTANEPPPLGTTRSERASRRRGETAKRPRAARRPRQMASQKDDAPPPPPLRRLSTATGREVTDEVIEVASRVFRERELPTLGFELGVLNTIAKTMVFAAAPQFLWLYALFEYPVLLVLVARSWAKSNNLLYFAEFCWIANSAGFLYLGFEALHALGGKGLDGSLETVLWMGPALRHSAARAFFAVANGPLAMTVLINKNALVFHDIERTAGFFIHFTPALVSWTMRWRFAEPVSSCEKPSDPLAGFLRLLPFSSDATPPTLTPSSLFAFNQATLVTTDASGDLLQSAVALYLVWWLGYAAWLLTIGYDLPNRGWGASSLNDAAPAIAKLYRVPKSRTSRALDPERTSGLPSRSLLAARCWLLAAGCWLARSSSGRRIETRLRRAARPGGRVPALSRHGRRHHARGAAAALLQLLRAAHGLDPHPRPLRRPSGRALLPPLLRPATAQGAPTGARRRAQEEVMD